MIRNQPEAQGVRNRFGKNVFHVVGTDAAVNVIQRVKFRRDTLLAFFERPEPVLVGLEACPGSQWLPQSCRRSDIRPAQFVKPYVKSNKNDTIDAAAIAEAVVRPTMRFVQVKQPDQVDLQALHRIRSPRAAFTWPSQRHQARLRLRKMCCSAQFDRDSQPS